MSRSAINLTFHRKIKIQKRVVYLWAYGAKNPVRQAKLVFLISALRLGPLSLTSAMTWLFSF